VRILIRKDYLCIRFHKELHYADFILIRDNKRIKLVRIRKPLLLWDIAQLKCCRSYGTILSLFGHNTVIEYDNIIIIWNEGIWPPSIDSLLFMRAMRHSNFLTKPIHSIIDLGCGTGVLGIYLAKNNSHIEHLYLVDINPEAIEISRYNVNFNQLKNNIHYCIGDSSLPYLRDVM